MYAFSMFIHVHVNLLSYHNTSLEINSTVRPLLYMYMYMLSIMWSPVYTVCGLLYVVYTVYAFVSVSISCRTIHCFFDYL